MQTTHDSNQDPMHILIIGNGGRELALAQAIGETPGVILGSTRWTDVKQTVEYARDVKADFVVIGPEAPLAAGLVDALQEAKIRVFGPTKKAAVLETSKITAMNLCRSVGIPTPRYYFCGSFEVARREIAEHNYLVVKADGLAAGKGAKVADTQEEAIEGAYDILCKGEFGPAGRQILLQERVRGKEAEMFFLCDGQEVAYVGSACDHKRRYNGDTGPMTGGMGAYSPTPLITPRILRQVRHWVSLLVRRMWINKNPFRGVLFVGLMLTEDKGDTVPRILEFNVRFGDPEAQVLLPLLPNITPYLLATLKERGLCNLRPPQIQEDRAAVCVVEVPKGYPAEGSRGNSFVGIGTTHEEARIKAYVQAEARCRPNMEYRTDIALNVPSQLEEVA